MAPQPLFAALLPLLLASCAGAPCALCYEDAWSKEPFPGQEKQHSPTPDLRKSEPTKKE